MLKLPNLIFVLTALVILIATLAIVFVMTISPVHYQFLNQSISNSSQSCENLLCDNFTKKPDRIIPCSHPSICEGGNVVLAFYGPQCYYSKLQAKILAKVYQDYKGKVKLYTVCVPLGPAEEDLCKDNPGFNITGDEAKELKEAFNVWGTPTLVFNCKYKRVGTAAAYDKAHNTNLEEQDLRKIFEILYGS